VTPASEGAGGYPIDVITSPSWEANGRLLALSVSSGTCQFCVRLLNTSSRGTTVQAASRVIARSPNLHAQNSDWNSTLIAPDGSQAVRTARSYIMSSLAEGDGPPFVSAARYAGGHRTAMRLPAQTITATW
jgi:hypothetical protein